MRLSLGKIFGIKVDIHWSFSLLIIYIVYTNLRAGLSAVEVLWSVLFVLSLFLCVTLHEFGHALAARRYGIQTKDITLYPIGGVAQLEKMPENPLHELIVALAGPLVNVVIVIGLSVFMFNSSILEESESSALIVNQTNFIEKLGWVNLSLAVFNLIPAFPMDGGRVLRALLSFKLSRLRATEIAATIGKAIAGVFIVAGFYFNPFLVLIGIFIIIGAHSEAKMVRTETSVARLTVRDALMTNFLTLDKSSLISEAVRLLLDGQAKSFLITENGKPFGVLNRDSIIKGITQFGEQHAVADVADTKLFVVDINTPLYNVFMEFSKSGQSVILVSDNNKFAGIVDLENISELVLINEAKKQSGKLS